MKALFIDGPAAGRVIQTDAKRRIIRIPMVDAMNAPTVVPKDFPHVIDTTPKVLEYYELSHANLPFDYHFYSNTIVPVGEETWTNALTLMEMMIKWEYDESIIKRLNNLEDAIGRLGRTLTNVMKNHRLSDQTVDSTDEAW